MVNAPSHVKPPRKSGRQPGAQPGNTNALKHGFYSRRFALGERLDLETVGVGIESEIAMLRVSTRRLFELADGEDDLGSMISVVGALGNAATRLGGLLRIQKILGGEDSGIVEAISTAIDEIAKEMNLQ